MRATRAEILPGSVWRQVKLGTEAVYAVLAVTGDHVEVEVRRAPGLRPGTTLRLTREAVAAMTRVDDGDGPRLKPVRPRS
jgi:hypothetical protein